MSYPQPSANDAATGGQTVFRLATPLTSPGDIYESPQGGYAFAIGPDSDVANVGVVFYNPQKPPTFQDQILISPNRLYQGLVPARGDVTYQPSARKGNTLFYMLDLYDPAYRPTGFNVNTDYLQTITPQLEVLQYFSPQPSVAPQRNDRTYYFQDLPSLIGHSSYTVMPYYGRNYLFMGYKNASAGPIDIELRGVNFAICDNSSSPIHQETVLKAATVAAGTVVNYRVNKDTTPAGMFDAIVFKSTQSITSLGHPSPLKFVFSDFASGAAT